MRDVQKVLELFPSPREAWANIERHQNAEPTAKMWVRQVEGQPGNDWAVVKEVQEPWEALVLV